MEAVRPGVASPGKGLGACAAAALAAAGPEW